MGICCERGLHTIEHFFVCGELLHGHETISFFQALVIVGERTDLIMGPNHLLGKTFPLGTCMAQFPGQNEIRSSNVNLCCQSTYVCLKFELTKWSLHHYNYCTKLCAYHRCINWCMYIPPLWSLQLSHDHQFKMNNYSSTTTESPSPMNIVSCRAPEAERLPHN